jgi:hypothetical protein
MQILDDHPSKSVYPPLLIRTLKNANGPVSGVFGAHTRGLSEKFWAKPTELCIFFRRVAIACLGVLIAVCSAGIPDPRVPAPPQKEDDGSYPIYADLTNADIKSGQELNSDQRSKMPDLSGES